MEREEVRLDPVTFEVLENAFVNLVDQMSEQILRTCYSFVIYCRDFSNALWPIDPEVCQYELDLGAARRERQWIRERRLAWLDEDPESVRERLLRNEIGVLDAIRRHGVIFDWGTKTVLPQTTKQFRSMLRQRSAAYWDGKKEARNG